MTRDQLATVTAVMNHVTITDIEDAYGIVTIEAYDEDAAGFDVIDVSGDGEPSFWKGNNPARTSSAAAATILKEWIDRP